MNLEALRQAKRVITAVPASRISMRTWKNECRSTACLAGHCCLDPWFNRCGLTLNSIPKEPSYPFYTNDEGFYAGFVALPKFFGLTYDDTCRLFDPTYYDFDAYDTPEKVKAEIIRRLDDTIEAAQAEQKAE